MNQFVPLSAHGSQAFVAAAGDLGDRHSGSISVLRRILLCLICRPLLTAHRKLKEGVC